MNATAGAELTERGRSVALSINRVRSIAPWGWKTWLRSGNGDGMKTEDLIRWMVADTRQSQSSIALLLKGLVPSLGFKVAMVWVGLGIRADIAHAMMMPVFVIRIVLAAGVGLVAARIALLLSRPGRQGVARLGPLAGIALVALALMVWACVTTPEAARCMATVGKSFPFCLVMIPVLSFLPVAAILFALRRGATTMPVLTAFVAGLSGAGMATAVYALSCAEDSPLFYVTWYGLAILGVAALTAAAGSRLLRW